MSSSGCSLRSSRRAPQRRAAGGRPNRRRHPQQNLRRNGAVAGRRAEDREAPRGDGGERVEPRGVVACVPRPVRYDGGPERVADGGGGLGRVGRDGRRLGDGGLDGDGEAGPGEGPVPFRREEREALEGRVDPGRPGRLGVERAPQGVQDPGGDAVEAAEVASAFRCGEPSPAADWKINVRSKNMLTVSERFHCCHCFLERFFET